MNDYLGEVKTNFEVAPGVYYLEVSFSALPFIQAGQFAMLEVPREDCILRRPLGICHATANTITFVYQVKGEGTVSLTWLEEGDNIRVTLPLGNGFPMMNAENVAIVGGGLGVVPLYITAEAQSESNVRIYNGFASE
ncbi:MAG: hypothetical protein IJX05_04225 [Clostridia bacterium]|nr:hypothetical protein [Clostridia bacterium]